MIASCTLVKKSFAGRTLLPTLLLRQLAEQLEVLGFVVHGALTRMCIPKTTVAGEVSTPVASKYVPVSTSQKGGALWIRAVASGGDWSIELPCALFKGLDLWPMETTCGLFQTDLLSTALRRKTGLVFGSITEHYADATRTVSVIAGRQAQGPL